MEILNPVCILRVQPQGQRGQPRTHERAGASKNSKSLAGTKCQVLSGIIVSVCDGINFNSIEEKCTASPPRLGQSTENCSRSRPAVPFYHGGKERKRRSCRL
eukprot:Pompholyxophrys_punicea_v1_NODE_162_length_3055_cov_4.636000.p9 type:complete len:102 gc:universal NODE_162_length_3055_cov_4.636000:2962-2657(-)